MYRERVKNQRSPALPALCVAVFLIISAAVYKAAELDNYKWIYQLAVFALTSAGVYIAYLYFIV